VTTRRAGGPTVACVVALACAVAGLAGCARPVDAPRGERLPATDVRLVAVFPVENLSGKPAPTDALRDQLIEGLRDRGLLILDDATLDAIVTRHRVRYTAGLERGFARALKQEADVDAVLIASLETYEDLRPPRVGVLARLIVTSGAPDVVWIDGAGGAGDDSPGILGIGLVDDARVLLARAVDELTASLASRLADGGRPAPPSSGRKFRPKIVYRSEALDPAQPYSVAVVPFFNRSERKFAGEIVALHMMRTLRTHGLAVVELGVVREQLLQFRIIMTDGVSLQDTDVILNAVNADLVLNGEVLEYHDPLGGDGAPRIDFSVLFIERRSRRVLYSSYSHAAGDDGVFFFDWGRVNSAHAMAAHMARAVTERMLLAPATPSARRGERERR
jgi:hypothetical protein